MSINITFRHLEKRYGKHTVIPDLSLQISKGEFFTLLGPSGCGKTTLLRMTAGFNSIEQGEVLFDDTIVNQISPDKRNIGMVFQNYAIFPHLSVRDNIAFGLKNRGVPRDQIRQKVDQIMEIVQIREYADRLPEKLSGGQQQRVALARAIVIQPAVLLMDEPLSNLDAKLRVELRNAIKEIQNRIGITTIYVTHDQEEAMAVSNRIAVMKDGIIQHVGTPKNIYQRPANLFVSTFIGRSNLLEATMEERAEGPLVTYSGFSFPVENVMVPMSGSVIISVRPEEFIMSSDGKGMRGKIDRSMFLGLNTHYFVTLEKGEQVEIIQESSVDEILKPGAEVFLRLKTEKINLFDPKSGKSLMRGVQNDDQGEPR